MKIAVIGGASTYTPELLEGFIEEGQRLGLDSVCLMDIDRERLRVVGDFCRRMLARAGGGFSLELTESLDQALAGAAFVVTQIRVGGQTARHQDILLGLRHGLVGQETTGVGGFAKALRTVPVLLDICRRMEASCPQAWLVNFTNPSGLVTEAMLKYGRERVIGLCNIPLNLQYDAAALLGVEPGRVELDSLGLNHLSWVRSVRLDGKEVLPQLLEKLADFSPANLPEELDHPPEFLRALGMVPSSYLRYFWKTREAIAKLSARPKTRAQEVMEIESELLAWYADPERDTKPPALSKRGGALYSRAAVHLIRALHLNTGERQVVDTRNAGAIGCLPEEVVVEVPCRVDTQGARPLAQPPPPPEIRGLLQHVKAYEELAVEACVRRSRRYALLALVTHPLVADSELAVRLLDELAANYGIDFSA